MGSPRSAQSPGCPAPAAGLALQGQQCTTVTFMGLAGKGRPAGWAVRSHDGAGGGAALCCQAGGSSRPPGPASVTTPGDPQAAVRSRSYLPAPPRLGQEPLADPQSIFLVAGTETFPYSRPRHASVTRCHPQPCRVRAALHGALSAWTPREPAHGRCRPQADGGVGRHPQQDTKTLTLNKKNRAGLRGRKTGPGEGEPGSLPTLQDLPPPRGARESRHRGVQAGHRLSCRLSATARLRASWPHHSPRAEWGRASSQGLGPARPPAGG